ncbi:MAG: T9SS type A sorting domain-containing protein, partial [Calditrichaeota bacterium]|nr:T9SS type A sorting domain-containing protein [Calditrichota bacterium]
DGSIVAWGWNELGQCDIPFPNSDFVALSVDQFHSLGLKADGSILAWGSNSSGQCNVPEPNTDFMAIAGGGFHSLGLKADGSIVAWGDNANGQCEIPEPNSGFVVVAASSYTSLGIIRPSTAVDEGDAVRIFPNSLSIRSVFPNPFNPSTTISFDTRAAGPLSLAVYDISGRRVSWRALGSLPAGLHQTSWDGLTADGLPAASGCYVLQLRTASGDVQSRKCLLLR